MTSTKRFFIAKKIQAGQRQQPGELMWEDEKSIVIRWPEEVASKGGYGHSEWTHAYNKHEFLFRYKEYKTPVVKKIVQNHALTSSGNIIWDTPGQTVEWTITDGVITDVKLLR